MATDHQIEAFSGRMMPDKEKQMNLTTLCLQVSPAL
jgi:hypothetical protein